MTSSGRTGVGVLITLVLIVGFTAAAFWAGTTYRRWSAPEVCGYVGIDPVRKFDPLHYNPNDNYTDWGGIKIAQRTQAAMLTSETLIGNALVSSKEIRETNWYKSFKNALDAKRWLADHFMAEPVEDSQLIKVYVTGVSDSHDAKKIIEAIVNTHLDQQRSVSTSKMLDRTAQLNTLKGKQEMRIHELREQQNNLMLHLNLGQIGTPARYTAIDVEYSRAMEEHIRLRGELAMAKAKLEALKKLNRPTEAIADAELRAEELKAGFEAISKLIETLKPQLGDLAISMSEYLSVTDELAATRASYKEVRDQFDTLGSQAAESIIDWKQRPAVPLDLP